MTYRSLTRATQPVVEPVTLTEAKAHLRVDNDIDNAYVMGLVGSARGWVEEYLDRTLVHTQWTMRLDGFPPNGMDNIELPRPPMATAAAVTAVAITYTTESGAVVVFPSNEYRVDRHSTPGGISPLFDQAWPVHRRDENAVVITWWGGYGEDGRSVPMQIRHAILMLVAHWYDRRESVLTGSISKEIEFGVHSLLDSCRWGTYR
jgi:uncharacterized phiE125 gp8 family phage protein